MKENKLTLLNHPSLVETLVSHTLLPANAGISEFDFLISPANTGSAIASTPLFTTEKFIQGIEHQYGTPKSETPKICVSFLLRQRKLLSLMIPKHNSFTGTKLKSAKGGSSL